jgi:hypothetical protein
VLVSAANAINPFLTVTIFNMPDETECRASLTTYGEFVPAL